MSEVVIDSHLLPLELNSVSLSTARFFCGQSIVGTGQAITKCSFRLVRSASPAGNVTAQIWSHTGMFGAGGVGSALLAESAAVAASSLTASPLFYEFTFTGVNRITLATSTNYVIGISYSSATGVEGVNVYGATGAPTHAGNASFKSSVGEWTTHATFDVTFSLTGSTGIVFTPPVSADRARNQRVLGVVRYWPPHDRGRNVWKKVDGTYTESQPARADIAIEYLGGHIHPITAAEDGNLTAAGYSANISV